MENSSNLFFCSTCSDKQGKVLCRECKGLRVAIYKNGWVRYWNYRLDPMDLKFKKWKRVFNKIRFVSTIILALNFWIWAAFFFNRDFSSTGGITWQAIPRISQFLFWLGSLFACYAWYRALVQISHKTPVEHYDFKVEKAHAPVSGWPELLQISHRKRINISESFTEEALALIGDAYLLAEKQGSDEVKPAHLFVSLLQNNRIANTFIRLGISPKMVLSEIEKLDWLTSLPRKRLPLLSEETYTVIFSSYELAHQNHQEYVSVTEILSAVAELSKEVKDLLFDIGVDERKLTNVIVWARIREKMARDYAKLSKAGRLRPKHGMDRAMTAVATPFLNRMSEDITARAQYGNVETCVAREKEVAEIFQVVEGGQNNVLLVGTHGVGKRSIVEGIAERMIDGDVPSRLNDKRLVQLSISSLLSGASPSGAIERLIMCLNEIARAGNIILFINDLHELLGVSVGQDDKSLDVAGTLAEFLSSGSFLVFATTTSEAFATEIDGSKLSTVFTRIEVKEMDEDQAIQVLESKTGYLEYKEKVFYAYEAIARAVELSRKFYRDTPLPGSALEVLTEAAVFSRSKKGADSLVLGEEVAAVVAQKTHIPLTAVSGDESEKLLHLEDEMHKRVVGQDEGVKLVASALRRARAEMRSLNRPIANFLFLGPTGVGKTELAKTIADVYFGGEKQMIRLDMSEYQEKSSIYRLIGEPGEKGTGILTEAVRRKPFALLLLDEIEKADRDILNLFLQVMDDGRLTDSSGRVVDFSNIIIIATSNAGTRYVQEQIAQGVDQQVIKEHLIRGELKDHFRPEFLNRFDGIVLFQPLSKTSIREITSLLLQRIGNDLEAKGIRLKIEEGALDYFSDVGFDPEFGARPLRRVLQEKVENKLADYLLSGKLHRRSTVVVGEGGSVNIS